MQPGFVLKSFILPEGEKKAFINICHSDVVDKATSARIKGDTRERWSIPLTMSPPREDLDKSEEKKCTCTQITTLDSLSSFLP